MNIKKITFVLLLISLVVLPARGASNLKNITVRSTGGYTEVLLEISENVSYSDFTMDSKIVVDLLESTSNLSGKKWEINRGSIKDISIQRIPSASLTRIIVNTEGKFDYEVKNLSNTVLAVRLNTSTPSFETWRAIKAAPSEEVPKEEFRREKTTTAPRQTSGKISMRLENQDLVTALRTIAQYSGMNMIIGDEVSGQITVELKNINWEKALDLILRTKGYTYQIDENVIRVGKAETFAKEMEREEMSKPLKRRIFTLEFATPGELRPTVEGALSNRGEVKEDTRTNSLIVTDIPSKLDEVQKMIKALDKRTQQVAINAKIVDMDRTAARELGLSWKVTNLREADWNVEGDVEQKPSPASPTGVFLNLATIKNFAKLQATLHALENNQRLKTVANPRITTVNNKEATIFGGKQFAITTTDINGQPITKFYKAGIELSVTPHINSGGDITMEVAVELSDVVPGAQNPTITQTTAGTQSLVKDGQTLVIGGFFTETATRNKEGIPILKDIPILGNLLFSKTTTENRKREVLIFITPHIVKSQLEESESTG